MQLIHENTALQQQWNQATIAHLGNIDITRHSNLKVSGICHQCPDGHLHRWEATFVNRSKGRGGLSDYIRMHKLMDAIEWIQLHFL